MTSVEAGRGIYQSGNPITLEADFVEGTSPAEPTAVVFNLRKPDDTIVTYTFGVDGNVTNPSPGEYLCQLPSNWMPGQTYYEAVATCPDVTLPGEFYVVPSSVIVPPLAPGPLEQPCTSWLAGEDLVGLPGSNGMTPPELDAAAVITSMLAYNAFARRWTGLCGPVTVRPCRNVHTNPTWGVASIAAWTWGFWSSGEWGGYGYDWGWGNQSNGRLCSCGYDSFVELAGYPVSQIVQVKVDGSVLSPTFPDGSPAYRLDEWRFLTRLSDPGNSEVLLYWPRCQRLDLPDTAPGTWSITYLWGVAPPPDALAGAKQLAGHVLLAMNGQACQLPENTRAVIRQGATIDRITPLASELMTGQTGMILWDAAILAHNRYGLRRPPSVFSPDMPYPVRVGNE